jgi:hypothetical protein
MLKQKPVVVLALVSLLALVTPAGAQTFLQTSAETVPSGVFEIAAYPTALFGRAGGPDRYGGAGRVGYGITDSLDVAAKVGVFNGFTLVGLDGDLWLLHGPVDMSLTLGAHKALIQDARNSTALDLAWLSTARVTRRLALSGGLAVSFESLDGVPNSGFERIYVAPGLRYRLSPKLDFVTQAGVGVNGRSPSYLTAGFAMYVPTPRAGHGGSWR